MNSIVDTNYISEVVVSKSDLSASKEIYNALQLKSVARIDYIVIGKQPFVIEVNTIPGFSKASIVPQMLSCQGIPLDEFWSMVIDVELNS